MKQLEKDVLKVWKIRASISFVFYVALVIGFIFVNEKFWHLPIWTYAVAGGGFFILGLLEYVVFPRIRYEHFTYEVRSDEVEVTYGLFIVTKMLIPMNRVQHVKTEQGPILKKYGLSALHISTASNTEKIPGLLEEEALSLRNTIANLAKVDEEDEQ